MTDGSLDGLQINFDGKAGTLADTGRLNQSEFGQLVFAQTLLCRTQTGFILRFGDGLEYPAVAYGDIDTDTQPIHQLRQISRRLDVAGDADETAVDNDTPA